MLKGIQPYINADDFTNEPFINKSITTIFFLFHSCDDRHNT